MPPLFFKVSVLLTITAAKGLEDVLLAELQQLCPTLTFQLKPGLVLVEGEMADMYRICLHSRLANRVLLQLAEGSVIHADHLYQLASGVDWPSHFAVERSFAVDFHGTDNTIRNTQFGALKVKDAVVDLYQQRLNRRPNVDKQEADWRLHVRLHRQVAKLYLDVSGGSLHQRHYRLETGEAPVKEHLAAAMLIRSGWTADMSKPLLDPMCGSGTVVIEAALMAANIAPGLSRRHWGFSHWLGHDDSLWTQLVQLAKQAQVIPSSVFYANDISQSMVDMARDNARSAGVEQWIHFSHGSVENLTAPCEQPGFIVTNPPYGERLGELANLLPLFASWGSQLKVAFKDWHVSMLTSNRDLLRQMKLSASKQYNLMNGKLECQLVNYLLDERNCEVREAPQNNDFANRLGKNLVKLKKWLKTQNINCYRVYDADLPEYNVAIDVYADWVVVQEYAAPKNVPEAKTRQRLMEVVAALPAALNVAADRIVLKVREQQKGAKQYNKLDQRREYIEVFENGAKLWVNLHDYLDTGLFLDHRVTRQLVQARSRHKEVLNLFSYTGSVSVHAALGGARRITTVDMSRTYLEWAKRNFSLNRLSGAYRFEQADCLQWLKSDRGEYDLIFIDPPSFSNSKRMNNVWDVQRDHIALLADAVKRLAPGGEIIFSNNLRKFKLDEEAVQALGLSITDWNAKTLPEDFKRNPKIHHCWLFTKQA